MHELEVPISSVVARHLGTGLLLNENVFLSLLEYYILRKGLMWWN